MRVRVGGLATRPTHSGHEYSGMKTPFRQLGIGLFGLLAATGCGAPSSEYQRFIDVGLSDFEAAKYPDAIAMFRSAAEVDPERQEASFYLGRCYLEMANRRFVAGRTTAALSYTDQAISSFERAIAAFPGYGAAVTGKADALRLHDRHAAALELADWAAANSGFQAQKLIIKARQYALAGDLDSARLAHNQAVAVEPESPAAHAELGLFYLRCGNDDEAVRSLETAYHLNPGTPGVVAALAQLGALSEVASAP